MNILIIGEEVNLKECQQKFGDQHSYTLKSSTREAEGIFAEKDLVFDFCIERDPRQIDAYQNHPYLVAFLNTTKVTLQQLGDVVQHNLACTLFGFAGLPTFLHREILETSIYKPEQKHRLEWICKELGTKFQIVEDRVGLVTPRVICMIINEAYYTVEEGTATREDIDLSMKLGTNYPYGPFEWAQKIGVKNVSEVLQAVYEDTKDERYKICPLLKQPG